jgi:transcriptional regulator of nitric oxide reductase
MTVPNGAVVGGAKDEVGDQRRPARLVAGVDAPAGVTVEVLVEGQQVVPVPVGLEEAGIAEDRAAALLVVEEDRNQTAGEVVGQDGSDRCAVGKVAAFTASGGSLTELSTSPFSLAAGAAPAGIVVS